MSHELTPFDEAEPIDFYKKESRWHLLWLWPLRVVVYGLYYGLFFITIPLTRLAVRRGWLDFMKGGQALDLDNEMVPELDNIDWSETRKEIDDGNAS